MEYDKIFQKKKISDYEKIKASYTKKGFYIIELDLKNLKNNPQEFQDKFQAVAMHMLSYKTFAILVKNIDYLKDNEAELAKIFSNLSNAHRVLSSQGMKLDILIFV